MELRQELERMARNDPGVVIGSSYKHSGILNGGVAVYTVKR